jgi:hypothetical protein
MSDIILLVLGLIVIALVTDIGAVIAWLRSRFEAKR